MTYDEIIKRLEEIDGLAGNYDKEIELLDAIPKLIEDLKAADKVGGTFKWGTTINIMDKNEK